ncbi:LOW QUALITY PROTEIN: otefin [Anopheles stephensi]|uniref:LOW QUALITY PROTEIN: otefin n=1 Tax=Anopheles stephensi TaxID=30069 RepID=UPI00165885A0|nr:LOW QUALITY PROTEIN: otefin [Anopheles stephensi]
MGDSYDEMSNDQLRLKLLEFGLANMPVTSTTRKVLIKKLRNHIATNGKRRETMNITSYSSDEDSGSQQKTAAKRGAPSSKKESANRRATIATVATAKPPKPLPSSQPVAKGVVTTGSEASKRRSGRVTPVKDKDDAPPASSQTAPKVPAILEDSDDDMIPLTSRNRKSASPSLSRADMLTTSYVHHMAVSSQPSEPILEEMDVDDVPEMDEVIVLDDDDDSNATVAMPPPQQPKPVYTQTTAQTTEMYRTFSTGTMTDPKAQGTGPSSYSSNTEKRRILPEFLRPPSERSTVRDATFSTMSDQKERQERNTFAEPEPVSFSTSTSKRVLPTFASSPSTTVRNEKKIDAPESPYLSEFTKRLARLRAEAVQQPTGLGRDSPSRRTVFEGSTSSMRSTYAPRDMYDEPPPSASRYRPGRQTIAPMSSSSSTIGGGRRTTAMQHEMMEDVRSSMRQTLLALDRKYSIRKVFYSIIIVLVVIFLFRFLFPVN